VLEETCRALLKVRGEASAAGLAEQVVVRYTALPSDQRADFLSFLIRELSPDDRTLAEAIARWQTERSPAAAKRLDRASVAPRRGLFESINTAPGGTACVLRMRSDCLELSPSEPELRVVGDDLADALGSWFYRGFLTLKRIDWNTPAAVLEKLIEYEAVHEIRGWDDLRRRLEHDRRCFGFFHPSLPGEPIIFVVVALTVGLEGSISAVLDAPVRPPDEIPDCDTAIFYSISNCQTGLRGIPLGSFLIKQVTERLRSELPGIATFGTLSPIPGYRAWVESTGGGLPAEIASAVVNPTSGPDADLRETVVASAAHYLIEAKRGHEPLDPVARFHLRNGARLDRINWCGDPSPRGMGQSYGMLVNYVYDPDTVADNHEAYVNEFRVASSAAVASLIT